METPLELAKEFVRHIPECDTDLDVCLSVSIEGWKARAVYLEREREKSALREEGWTEEKIIAFLKWKAAD